MTVEELIKALGDFDPKTKVLVEAQDTGYHDVGSLELISVVFNAQEDSGWEGPHLDADSCLERKTQKALRIRSDYNA